MNGPGTGEIRVIGVDLAAQPQKTAYCEIVVRDERAEVTKQKHGVTDECLLCVFPGAARIGIDAPFGWPAPFVDALQPYADQNIWPARVKRKARWFGDLALRQTDKYVDCQVPSVTPKSASTDKLGAVAMRAAYLLSRAPDSVRVDRTGMNGHVVEVYPAAALARWGVKTKVDGRGGVTYRNRDGGSMLRRQMVRHLTARLDASHEVVTGLASSEHAVDALAAALVALMVEIDPKRDQGFIEPIPSGKEPVAKREGWIALPKLCSLTRLRHWLSERNRPASTTR